MEPVKYLINPLDFAYVSVCAFVVPCSISVLERKLSRYLVVNVFMINNKVFHRRFVLTQFSMWSETEIEIETVPS